MFRQKTSLTISSKFLLSTFFSPFKADFIRMAHNHLPSELVRDSKPSIWVEFTALAAECGAVNLGQVRFYCGHSIFYEIAFRDFQIIQLQNLQQIFLKKFHYILNKLHGINILEVLVILDL
jgi:hypothetical protein